MSFTELQKKIIYYHLGYLDPTPLGSILQSEIRVVIDNLDSMTELLVVGDVERDDATVVNREGTAIATTESLLGRCELAWQKITDVDDSMLVAQTGEGLKLRGNELSMRRNHYYKLRSELASALGVTIINNKYRVGYSVN